jgi:hypothetical protein
MHTVYVLIGGFLTMFIAMLISRNTSISSSTTFKGFSVFWFVCAGVNMWIGIYQVGYTFLDELPMFFVVFIPPVAILYLLNRYKHIQK